jgi:hypothetical protein
MVKALAGYGVKQRQIAALLDLASTTRSSPIALMNG